MQQMKAISGTQMRTLDQRTIAEKGIPGEVLMERAGIAAGKALEKWSLSRIAEPGRNVEQIHFVFLAGKGNNGGDAFVAAKFLHEQGYAVSLYCAEAISRIKGDALIHFRRMPRFLQEMASSALIPDSAFAKGNILVDALLGTGFSGSLKEEYAVLCRRINDSGAFVAAMDIPSGLNADTGEADPDAVCAHLTLTMALPKKGMFSARGIRLTGRLQVLEIGINREWAEDLPEVWECTGPEEAASFLKKVPFDTHKNARGHVFVFGGSSLYSGAILLCAESSLRSGAGLTSCFIPEGMRIYSSVPKALMMRMLPSDNGFLQGDLPDSVDLSRADSIAAGPGMGTSEFSVSFLEQIFAAEKPLTLDADGLNLLALHPVLQRKLPARKAPTVLTPHPGEMKRLLDAFAPGRSFASRMEQALFLAEKCRAVVVLKGARTVVASPDGRTALNLSGSPVLATAGSGDVLCGILAALAADSERDLFDSVRLGVFLHGLCGEFAERSGNGCCIADDLLPLIGKAMQSLRSDF